MTPQSSDDPDGLALWNYDRIEQRAFGWSLAHALLRRTAEIVWIEFDSNPAVAANMVLAVQTIEDFLRRGAATAAPEEVVRAIREHLLDLRVPGPSTCVEVTAKLDAPEGYCFLDHSLRMGPEPGPVWVPGPDYAGLYGGSAPAPRVDTVRLLARPGTARLESLVTVHGPSPTASRVERAAISHDLEIAPGTLTRFELLVDARGWPEVRLLLA